MLSSTLIFFGKAFQSLGPQTETARSPITPLHFLSNLEVGLTDRNRQKYRKTDRQKHRKTDRQTDRQKDKKTEREKDRKRNFSKISKI